jgi:Lar family restriction alleviation protein
VNVNLNCPFCGGGGQLETIVPGAYYIRCVECGATGGVSSTWEKAYRVWNTRLTEVVASRNLSRGK